MSSNTANEQVESGDRFEESHNLRYGVVQDDADLEDKWMPEETTITVTEWPESDYYCLSMADPMHWLGTKLMFDSLSYSTRTLWFERTVGDETITTGTIGWYILDPTRHYGLVGEWFREQLDLDPFRTGAKCPECGSEILNDEMVSACENLDCDVSFEGVPAESWERYNPEEDTDE